MEKRLRELLELAGTGLSSCEGLELVGLVCKLALGKEPDLHAQDLGDVIGELKNVLTKSSDKEVVEAIQILVGIVEGKTDA
ncbi:MAG: hypothetical protein KAR42_15280 [candidate division Zixibacteria bacterium]|nr:hypothetical protein [candidate division Zixibacteria bacterium]